MAGHLTLTLVKPHVLLNKQMGKVISKLEDNGFSMLLSKALQILPEGFEELFPNPPKDFSFEEQRRSFTIGPCWAIVLHKENAVEELNVLAGDFVPEKAAEGTLRKLFGKGSNNVLHCSQTDHDAKRELNFFFSRELAMARVVEEKLAGRNK